MPITNSWFHGYIDGVSHLIGSWIVVYYWYMNIYIIYIIINIINIWISYFTEKTSVCLKKTWDSYRNYNIGIHVSWQWIMTVHKKQYFHAIFVVDTNITIAELYSKRQFSFLLTHNFYAFVWLHFLIVTIHTFWVEMSFWAGLFTHWGQGTHVCISELGHLWFK